MAVVLIIVAVLAAGVVYGATAPGGQRGLRRVGQWLTGGPDAIETSSRSERESVSAGAGVRRQRTFDRGRRVPVAAGVALAAAGLGVILLSDGPGGGRAGPAESALPTPAGPAVVTTAPRPVAPGGNASTTTTVVVGQAAQGPGAPLTAADRSDVDRTGSTQGATPAALAPGPDAVSPVSLSTPGVDDAPMATAAVPAAGSPTFPETTPTARSRTSSAGDPVPPTSTGAPNAPGPASAPAAATPNTAASLPGVTEPVVRVPTVTAPTVTPPTVTVTGPGVAPPIVTDPIVTVPSVTDPIVTVPSVEVP